MKFFLLLLIFLFPTLIFGIQCAVGGKCYQSDITNLVVDVPIKTCKDACVYFKCANHITDKKSETFVREGYGCLEDFLNVCKYAPTNFKEDAAKNIKNFSISNDDLVFRSCSDKNECSTNGSKTGASDNVKFNIGPVYKEYNRSGCTYNSLIPKVNLSSTTTCNRELGCLSGNYYLSKGSDSQNFNKYGGQKECDGCLQYKCSNDGGNTVIKGYGCWDDFEYACPSVPDDIKEGIKRNINDSFYYGKHYMVISCNTAGVTSYYCFSSDDYKDYNPSAEKMFKANINKNFYEFCQIDFATTPSPPTSPSTTTSSTPSSSSITTVSTTEASPSQANGLKLNELILIGLFIAKVL